MSVKGLRRDGSGTVGRKDEVVFVTVSRNSKPMTARSKIRETSSLTLNGDPYRVGAAVRVDAELTRRTALDVLKRVRVM